MKLMARKVNTFYFSVYCKTNLGKYSCLNFSYHKPYIEVEILLFLLEGNIKGLSTRLDSFDFALGAILENMF